MEALELQKALSLEKRMYALLNEAFDISKQLAEAIERGDQVTIRILLSMRREPLESLRRIRRALEEQRDALAPAQARQLAELLNGAAAAGKVQRWNFTEKNCPRPLLLMIHRTFIFVLGTVICRGQSVPESC